MIESIITALAVSLVLGGFGAYITVKLIEERMQAVKAIVNRLEETDRQQAQLITQLEMSHSLTSKYMEDFRKEQKEENKITREVLGQNTKAIGSLEALLERIEKKLA